MPVLIECPECESQVQVPEEFFGQKVQCPLCWAHFVVQQPSLKGGSQDEGECLESDTLTEQHSQRRRKKTREPHRGSLILGLRVVSILCCPIPGPLVWMMAYADLEKIRQGRMDRSGEKITETGEILVVQFS